MPVNLENTIPSSTDPTHAEPWDRMPGEPALWHARFEAYRLLGPARTLEGVWKAEKGANRSNGRAPGSWYEQASRWRWRMRAEAWDAHERPRLQAERLALLQQSQKRHLEMALLQQAKALAALEAIEPLSLTPDQALRLLLAGIELERRCLEEPIVSELQHQVDELRRSQEG